MTQEEARQILRMLQSAFPQRYKGMSKSDVDKLLEQWTLPEPFPAVKTAVQKAIDTMTFHPSIAEIKALMQKDGKQESGQPTLEDFKSMLLFYASMLRSQIKSPKKLETETDKQRSDEAQQKLDALYERYGHLLEG